MRFESFRLVSKSKIQNIDETNVFTEKLELRDFASKNSDFAIELCFHYLQNSMKLYPKVDLALVNEEGKKIIQNFASNASKTKGFLMEAMFD